MFTYGHTQLLMIIIPIINSYHINTSHACGCNDIFPTERTYFYLKIVNLSKRKVDRKNYITNSTPDTFFYL